VNRHPIDLWTIHLDSPEHPESECLKLLSDAEKARAGRFHSSGDRQRFAAAHAGLRRVLSGYLSFQPELIRFTHNAHAKPGLDNDQNPGSIQFNLSHSAEMALVAISVHHPVGVDVERIKTLRDHLKLAERHFAQDEVAALKDLDPAGSTSAFIQLWAGKEAFIKARGIGLCLPLDRFSLADLITDPDTHVCSVADTGDGLSWWIHKLQLPAGYLGALAVEGGPGNIQYRSG
jgi:4'-phosphopantetheinyl transferase